MRFFFSVMCCAGTWQCSIHELCDLILLACVQKRVHVWLAFQNCGAGETRSTTWLALWVSLLKPDVSPLEPVLLWLDQLAIAWPYIWSPGERISPSVWHQLYTESAGKCPGRIFIASLGSVKTTGKKAFGKHGGKCKDLGHHYQVLVAHAATLHIKKGKASQIFAQMSLASSTWFGNALGSCAASTLQKAQEGNTVCEARKGWAPGFLRSNSRL